VVRITPSIRQMGQAIGNILPLAIGIAISPLGIVAVVLMLATPQATSNGGAYAIGSVVGLGVVCGVVLAVSSGNATADSGGPATWVSALKLAIGIGAVLLAVRQWRERPKPGEEANLPKWMGALDKIGPGKALGLGVVASALNPKNLGLCVSAATTIAQVGMSGAEEAGTAAIFIGIATLSIVGPVVAYLVLGERARRALDELKSVMVTNNAAIMAVLFLVLGAKLIGESIQGFGH
jgi:threonine/homoserine/homoserine lactone efflux protein